MFHSKHPLGKDGSGLLKYGDALDGKHFGKLSPMLSEEDQKDFYENGFLFISCHNDPKTKGEELLAEGLEAIKKMRISHPYRLVSMKEIKDALDVVPVSDISVYYVSYFVEQKEKHAAIVNVFEILGTAALIKLQSKK